jgi:hypothetical protein
MAEIFTKDAPYHLGLSFQISPRSREQFQRNGMLRKWPVPEETGGVDAEETAGGPGERWQCHKILVI